MGYAFMMGTCYGCKKIFSFNPVKVPSIRVNDNKEPICAECVEKVNPLRIANGLEPIVPAPDAYEACDENNLGYRTPRRDNESIVFQKIRAFQ